MNPSKNAIELIEREEGLVLHAYQDIVGIWTIGYGTIRYPNGDKVKEGDIITKAQAEEYLWYEVNNKCHVINSLIKNVTLNQNQFDALVSFVYNLGAGALEKSTLLKVIRANPDEKKTIKVCDIGQIWMREWLHNEHEIPIIEYWFCRYCFAGDRPRKSLFDRRRREYELYSS